ncbi:MAG: TIGR02265 family protein [Calditrichaeota bacterium]|nr:TIGR02265 family protein [Calditrichota bacterium]
MRDVRGLVLLSRIEFLENELDGNAMKQLADMLSPQTREMVTEQIFPVNRYPFSVLKEIDQVIPQLVSLPLEELFRKIGTHFAPIIVDRYFYNYMVAHQPDKFLVQFKNLYLHLWGFGEYAYDFQDRHRVTLSFEYEEDIHKPYCWFVQAFFTESIQLCGGKQVVLNEMECDAENGERCVYKINWQEQ